MEELKSRGLTYAYQLHSLGDYIQASKRMGFEARISFEEGLAKLL